MMHSSLLTLSIRTKIQSLFYAALCLLWVKHEDHPKKIFPLFSYGINIINPWFISYDATGTCRGPRNVLLRRQPKIDVGCVCLGQVGWASKGLEVVQPLSSGWKRSKKRLVSSYSLIQSISWAAVWSYEWSFLTI